MLKKKIEEKKEKTPNPQEIDKALAQLIGWMANLIGMVRKFPQSRERDQAVFTTRRILKQLRSLRDENTRPFVKKEVVKKREEAEKREVEEKGEGAKKEEEKRTRPREAAPKKKAAKKKAQIIFKKEAPETSK